MSNGGTIMTPFLTVANVRYVEAQLKKIVNSKLTTQDKDVLAAVKGIALSNIKETVSGVDQSVLDAIEKVEDRIDAELLLENLKAYTIPFHVISEKALEKLFRKDKKLKLPKLAQVDWKAISYLSWVDVGSHRQYIVVEKDDQFIGLRGTVEPQYRTKGICAICQKQGDVHLFTAKVKRNEEAFTTYSQYICSDAERCNQQLERHERIIEFVEGNLV